MYGQSTGRDERSCDRDAPHQAPASIGPLSDSNLRHRFLLCRGQQQWSRHMRTRITFLLASLLALMLAGCENSPPPGGDGMEKRIADLEKGAAAMQEQNRDLRTKLRAAHTFGRSPLADFFASPEFWECTYDSSWSDCSSRCSKQTASGYKACIDAHPEGAERVACIEENSTRGSTCLRNCPVQVSPTSPPACIGGGGPM